MLSSKLALHGAPPTLPEGPPNWPLADASVQQALRRAFDTGQWGRYDGPLGQALTARLADLHGLPHALTCCSGTFAVELALRALGVGEGDEVVLAGYDFSGNFRCIDAVGGKPVLTDITSQSWCLNAEQVERVLSDRVRAVIVSHLHGGLAPMRELRALADQNDFFVVEDACQAPGASVQGRMAGTWGDVGVLSFGGSKLLTAGRGGAIITARPEVYQRAKIYCERGNNAFALSELQAAVLAPQLELLAERNVRRRESVSLLLRCCQQLPGLRPLQQPGDRGEPAFYKLAWLYDNSELHRHSRDDLVRAIQAEGVHMDVGFRGFTKRSARRCRRPVALPASGDAASNTVVLHHPVLLQPRETIERVAEALRRVTLFLAQQSPTDTQ